MEINVKIVDMKKLCFLLVFLTSFGAYAQTYTDFERDTIGLDEVKVYGSAMASKSSPFSFAEIKGGELKPIPLAEPAYVLAKTPSITFYSDNGSNMGYVYYRLRGIDQTRLNVTLNGIPISEPEDQGSYFNNFPNFMGSVKRLQVIRGAGLSKSGVASFAGSINFETISDASGGEYVMAGAGSYGTYFTDALVGNDKVFVRLGQHKTDGFKRGSFNESWGGSYGGKSEFAVGTLSFFGMIGKQENGMAWVGEKMEVIKSDPRFNTNMKWETDDFVNTHNQVNWTAAPIKESTISISVFHQYQSGWYDTDMSLFDPSSAPRDWINRIKLRFNWYGVQYNQNYDVKNFTLNWGLTYNRHNRKHWGLDDVGRSGMVVGYENSGVKDEYTQYLKGEYRKGRLSVYGDIQNRYVKYDYVSPDTLIGLRDGSHINLSGGVTYRLKNGSVHYGITRNYREPRRSDMLGGYDNYWGEMTKLADERVLSQDIGYKSQFGKIKYEVNAYNMSFRNELMPTGGYGQNGITLYGNVKRSYRRGAELWAEYEGSRLKATVSSTLSRNRYLYDEWRVPEIPHDDVYRTSILSPSFTGNATAEYRVCSRLTLGSSYRYNSSAYIDRDNTEEFVLPAYGVMDLFVGIFVGRAEVKLNVNNVLDSLNLSNGMIGFDGNPRYFVMAGRNALVTIKFKL